jgi:beta-mannosidase
MHPLDLLQVQGIEIECACTYPWLGSSAGEPRVHLPAGSRNYDDRSIKAEPPLAYIDIDATRGPRSNSRTNEADMSAKRFTSTPLTSGWEFKQGDSFSHAHGYLPADDAPTEVHRDLLKNGKIADPFQDLNELSVSWVGDEKWTYRTTFAAPAEYNNPGVGTTLNFAGLDTFATVWLNGQLLLRSENMFIEYRRHVTSKLKSEDNVLEIVFESARKKGLELIEEDEGHQYIVHQTEVSRGPVRKAQYHWGWDWGPILMACGIWKPITLETWTCRLSNPYAQCELAENLKSADVKLSVFWEGQLAAVDFLVKNKKKELVGNARVSDIAGLQGFAEVTITIHDVELWWPRGHGDQNLYTIEAWALVHDEDKQRDMSALHMVSRSFGFRKSELIQEKDSHGTSFYFRINNVDIVRNFHVRTTCETYTDFVHHHLVLRRFVLDTCGLLPYASHCRRLSSLGQTRGRWQSEHASDMGRWYL